MPGAVLITGGRGYVAGHLATALRAQFPQARLVGTSRRAGEAGPFDTWIAADLEDRAAARSLVERAQPDQVFHLAARREGDLASLLAGNVLATDHLLTALRERRPRARVVVLGSAAEIGDCRPEDLPLAEDAPCRPLDGYGVSKLAQSALAGGAFRRHGQDVVRVRAFNLIGPGLPENLLPGRVVALLARRGGAAAEPLRFRDLQTERDYLDVRDLARALILAFERGEAGALYHTGTGRAVAGREIVERLIALAAPGTPYEETLPGAYTVPRQAADARLAERVLGWTPAIALETSLQQMWESASGAQARTGSRS